MKLKNPCLSFEARGQFGDIIIFQHRNKQNLAYQKKIIENRSINGRKVARIDYSECVYAWKIIFSADKIKWENLGRVMRMIGINLFVKWWFTELFNSRYGVGYYGGTRYGCVRTTPKINPYYMENVRKLIYGE